MVKYKEYLLFQIKVVENKQKDKPIHGDYSSNIAIELFQLLKKVNKDE